MKWGAVVFLAGFGLLVTYLPHSRAATVEGLYEAEVPVAGQDVRERDRALRAGLLQVVVRVSGQRRVTPTGVLSAALQNPSRYVKEFSYRSGSGAEDPRARGAGQRLWVRFDPSSTDDLLRQAGVPVWGRARPSFIVWLAVEGAQGLQLVGPGEFDAVPGTLRERALARGVPLLMPTLDPQDRARVKAADIAADRPAPFVQASTRYGAEAVLIGRARERVPGIWETRWTLVAGDLTERFSVDGERLEEVAGEGLDRAVDLLAQHSARTVASRSEEPLPELTVTGVSGYGTYVRVRRYLEGLDTVSGVRVTRLGPGGVTFALTGRADRESISQVISQGGGLKPVPSGEGAWVFQLTP